MAALVTANALRALPRGVRARRRPPGAARGMSPGSPSVDARPGGAAPAPRRAPLDRTAAPRRPVLVLRPRRVRRAAWAGAVALVAAFIVVASCCAPPTPASCFRAADQVAMVLLGVLLAARRPAAGPAARTGRRRRRRGPQHRRGRATCPGSWSGRCRSRTAPRGRGWTCRTTSTSPCMAVQAVDGQRAVEAIRAAPRPARRRARRPASRRAGRPPDGPPPTAGCPATAAPFRAARSIGPCPAPGRPRPPQQRPPYSAHNNSDRHDDLATTPPATRPAPGAPGDGVRIGDIVLRNRVVTSSSLLGYGVANSRARALRHEPGLAVRAALGVRRGDHPHADRGAPGGALHHA